MPDMHTKIKMMLSGVHLQLEQTSLCAPGVQLSCMT